MTFAAVASLFGVWILAIMSPGPDIVMLTHQATRGRGVPAALGVVVGVTIWIIASLGGLLWLTTRYPQAYAWVVRIGATFLMLYGAYIVWSGIKPKIIGMKKSSPAPPTTKQSQTVTPSSTDTLTRWRTGFLIGLATNLSNPKALAFFTALFASMVPQPMTLTRSVWLTIALVIVAIIWFVSFAQMVQSAVVQRFVARYQHLVDTVLGVVLLIMGAIIVVEA